MSDTSLSLSSCGSEGRCDEKFQPLVAAESEIENDNNCKWSTVPARTAASVLKDSKPEYTNEKYERKEEAKIFDSMATQTLKKCNCRKNQCRKSYCECYKSNRFCGGECNCKKCHNRKAMDKVSRKSIHKSTQLYCQCSKTQCREKSCLCFSNNKSCGQLCECKHCSNLQSPPSLVRSSLPPNSLKLCPIVVKTLPRFTVPSLLKVTLANINPFSLVLCPNVKN